MFAPDEPDEPSESDPYATPKEVEEHYGKLTDNEKCILARWAQRNAGKSHYWFGDGTDLLATVLFRMTIKPPKRKWYPKKIEFFPFLMGAVRSVGHSWGKKAKKRESPLPARDEEQLNNEQTAVNDIHACLEGKYYKKVRLLDFVDRKVKGDSLTDLQKHFKISRYECKQILEWIQKILKDNGYWYE